MQVIQALRISLVAIPVNDYHWQLHCCPLLSILPVLEDPRSLSKLTVDWNELLLTFVVGALNLDVTEHSLEEELAQC